MKKHLFPVLILCLISLWSLRSIFHPGFMYSHDSFWHVERLMNMSSMLKLQFPVRWSPTLDNGYGIPLFNFTYPAPYYLGAGLMALGLGPVKTYDLLLLLGYLFGGLGVYALARRKPLIGIIAALLYLFAPYQFLDLFVRGALGEVIALGLIPWVFLSFSQLSASGKLRWYSPLPFALLLLSHNFFGYLFGGVITFLILFVYPHKIRAFSSLLLSLALASFFLLPAFAEKSYLLFTQTNPTSYLAHFVYPAQLLYSKWIYLGSVAGNDPGEMSFQLGLANIVLLVGATLYCGYAFIKRLHLSSAYLYYLVITLLSIFMLVSPSTFIWQLVPLLPSLQFPWRFLGLTTALLPLLYLELSTHFGQGKKKNIFVIFSLLLVFLAIINTRNYHRPVKWMTETEFLALHYEYVGKNTTAQRSELVPRWAPVERWRPPGDPLKVEAATLIHVTEHPYTLDFTATAQNQDSRATYYKNYYPMYIATVDGQPIPLTPTTSGEISLSLTPGTHTYQVSIRSTPIQQLGNLLTLLSILLIGMIEVSSRRHR